MDTETQQITKWCALVQSRRDVIGESVEAKTGEEFTTSGDLELDNRVAAILLNTRQSDLPNYGVVDRDGSILMGRELDPLRARSVQVMPVFLFTIDWALTAPGLSWPESYYVTYVPARNARIVTASRDDADIWGYCDLAIGMCRAVRTAEFGVKKIIQSWWRRSSGCEPQQPWEAFVAAGLIDQRRAERWRDEVFRVARDEY